MMSLVATPVVAARVTVPKKAARKTMTVKASITSDSAKSVAIAGAVSLTMIAQPALAAVENAFPIPAAQEIAMVADAGEDAAKKAKAKALALSLQNALVAQDAKEGKIVTYGVNPTKTKNLASPSSPSGPSFSLPKLGGGEKKAPTVKGEKAAPAPTSEGGNGQLGLAMVVLFSPLLAVGLFSLQTLTRVVPQAAQGKDFFPKDTLPF